MEGGLRGPLAPPMDKVEVEFIVGVREGFDKKRVVFGAEDEEELGVDVGIAEPLDEDEGDDDGALLGLEDDALLGLATDELDDDEPDEGELEDVLELEEMLDILELIELDPESAARLLYIESLKEPPHSSICQSKSIKFSRIRITYIFSSIGHTSHRTSISRCRQNTACMDSIATIA